MTSPVRAAPDRRPELAARRGAPGRVQHRVGPGRRLRSGLGLLLTALVLGVVLAAALSVAVWAIASAIHHAATA
ncbi:MAG TPA: hypothetical protein VFP61_10270 [Acidimicrobiales bacterium]|nr:hypothetical protein [Acidimicrobiales bacterium]